MTERKTIIRFFVDYEKEEQWVNHMCQQGWHLVKFGFGYFKFEKGLPGQYIYRNELLAGLAKKDDSKEYLAFLREAGVEIVSKFGVWAYFRKNADNGPFELYSDTSSKIQYLNRILYLFIFMALINYIFGISYMFDYLNNESSRLSIIGIFNLLAAFIITIPSYLVFKRRKALKSNLNIFHD
ncbi:hypothetical protein UACE39S_00556 [Ureibacillus acetophenoni]